MGDTETLGGAFGILVLEPNKNVGRGLLNEVAARLAEAKRSKLEEGGVTARMLEHWFPISPYIDADTLLAGAVRQYHAEAGGASKAQRATMREVLQDRFRRLNASDTAITSMMTKLDDVIAASMRAAIKAQAKPESLAKPERQPKLRGAARPKRILEVEMAAAESAESGVTAKPQETAMAVVVQPAPAPVPKPTAAPKPPRPLAPAKRTMASQIAAHAAQRQTEGPLLQTYVEKVSAPAPRPVVETDAKPGANPWGLPEEWAGDEVLNRIARNFENGYSRAVSGQREKVRGDLRASLEKAGLNKVDTAALSTQLIARMDARLGLVKLAAR